MINFLPFGRSVPIRFTCKQLAVARYGNATAGISRFSSWYQTTASVTETIGCLSGDATGSKVVVAFAGLFNALFVGREKVFLRLEVVIVVFQAKKLFRFSHCVVQLAVTHQHPEIQQVTAVSAGKVSP
jgi:hypothetical protein